MEILITGGTGLIGRRLCEALRRAGHGLTVLSRKPASVTALCGAGVRAFADLRDWTPDVHFDAVINLAGEPIVDAAWSEQRKAVLLASRVGLTERLVQCIAAAEVKPSVLLSGSAVGYYGDCGDRLLDESAPAADDFAASMCREWEQVADSARSYGVRVCLLRTGLVLDKDGGLYGKMRRPFSFGLGARLGDGRQWMSWIHSADYAAIVLGLLVDVSAQGPFNMTAPQPATNAEFTRELATALHRPALFVAPAWLLRMALQERAYMLLGGQRVLPKKLEAAGYRFLYPDLRGALRAIVA